MKKAVAADITKSCWQTLFAVKSKSSNFRGSRKKMKPFIHSRYHATENKWVVVSVKWWDNVKNLALYKIGWVYRSQAEAEAALPAVATEMGVRYEL